MRRSGSSSCMLRPKESMDSMDVSGQDQQLSVTMISREELPSYSTERFFMLSEFHLNSHSMRFISDLEKSVEITPDTVETVPTASTSFMEEFNSETEAFPPYLLVYVLWRPDMTTSVHNFTDSVIVSAVTRVQSHVDIALSDEDKKPRQRADSSTLSPGKVSSADQ